MWAGGGEESEYWHCLDHCEETWLIRVHAALRVGALKRPFAGRLAQATARRVRTTTTPRDSNDYADDSADKAAKPGATDMPDKQRRTARSAYGRRLPAKSTMTT